MRRCLVALLLLGASCAPLAREHQGDGLFRQALIAQLSYDDSRAEALYRDVLALGLDWSPVWNNLAVIQVHRRQYPAARKLLAQAVASNERDLVALTNYGVISYHLCDYGEARRTLEAARELRVRILSSIPSDSGRTSWEEEQYARLTAPLEDTARRYLARIDAATISDAPAPASDLMADIRMNDAPLPRARF